MQTAIAVFLIIFAGVCLIAYLSLWNAIDDIKNSLDYIKSTCNNDYQIKQTEYILRELISTYHKDILTEIACLATKNSEDIKRMGGNFEAWDLIELDGRRLLITDFDTDDDGNIKVHCINDKGKAYTYYRDAPVFKNCAYFIKHSVSPFEEQE